MTLTAPADFFDGVFRWSADQIRDFQEQRFSEVIAAGWRTPFYRRLWTEHGLEPGDVRGIDDISMLPFVDVGRFREALAEKPPIGSHTNTTLADPESAPYRIFTSGGTTGTPRFMVYEPAEWSSYVVTLARCLYAHGTRAGDVVQVPMTFGLHIGAFAIYHALVDVLRATPVTTSSGAVTPTSRQVELMEQLSVKRVVGFPDYMVYLAEHVRAEGRDPATLLPALEGFTVAGIPDRVEAAWGRPANDFFGASEYGMIGCQLPGEHGLRIWDDAAFVELIDPHSGGAVEETGAMGSLVVTSLFRTASPLIRFDTHDLTRRLAGGGNGCNLTHIDHHRGRSDGMIRIKGVNIWPEACAEIVNRQPLLNGQYFCVIDSGGTPPRDSIRLLVEVRGPRVDRREAERQLADSLRSTFDVKIDVEAVETGSLAAMTGYGVDNKIRRFEDRRAATPAPPLP